MMIENMMIFKCLNKFLTGLMHNKKILKFNQKSNLKKNMLMAQMIVSKKS